MYLILSLNLFILKISQIIYTAQLLHNCMTEENNLRIVFRPTMVQHKRLNALMGSGKYKHLSELIRHILEIGMDELEEKHN